MAEISKKLLRQKKKKTILKPSKSKRKSNLPSTTIAIDL